MNRDDFIGAARDALSLSGIQLQNTAIEQLYLYYRELFAWNKRINLISKSEKDCFIERHLIDSLCALQINIGESSRILDLGSGNGLPGIPLAVALPAVQVDLLESRVKRCTFLRHAISLLRLTNTSVHCGRLEQLRSELETYEYILARGVKLTPSLRNIIAELLGDSGIMVLYQSEGQPIPDDVIEAFGCRGVEGRRIVLMEGGARNG